MWNVLIGDMSLVGPRPFTPCQEQMYSAAGGRQYYALRPGVTGAWQVAGSGADGQTSFAARAGFDNDYAASLSLMSDLKIIYKTVLTVLRMNGQ
jgi:lipopolysaccharide/colanic/teichoic acid biosynthesis glycosyltransferase